MKDIESWILLLQRMWDESPVVLVVGCVFTVAALGIAFGHFMYGLLYLFHLFLGR